MVYLDDMTREVENLVRPYAVDLVREGGKIVELSITAVPGGELDPETLYEALRTLMERFRREQTHQRMSNRKRAAQHASLAAMRDAYRAGEGRVTSEYLARLAVSYAELAGTGVNITETIAGALGDHDRPVLPLPTVRTHIARARKEGFLSETTQGREDGEATPKARQVIAESVE